ncbi:MAG: hypothetical protein WD557_04220 [Dehalococcoidia bacterium]
MRVQSRQRMPSWAVVLAVLGLLVFLDGAYIGVMQLLIDVSDPTEDPDTRDLVYLYVHVGFLLVGAILGFLLGKWVNGLGFACAVLVVTVLATSMVFALLTSRAVTCNSDAEFLRHWTC